MLLAAVIMFICFAFYWFMFALCRAAAWGDRSLEEDYQEVQKEDGHKWCTDECYRCEQNDWCKFSEVKREGQNEESSKLR